MLQPVTLSFLSGDSTVPTALSHTLSVILAPCMGHGISLMRMLAHILGIWWISFENYQL